MKCQHGNEIVVIVEPVSDPYWDDGLIRYDSAGQVKTIAEDANDDYIRVQCPQCKVALVHLI